MAIKLGSQNLIGGKPGIGVNLAGFRFGFGEGVRGDALSAGPKGLIGDTVKVRGRMRGFLILERQGGHLSFVKTAKKSRPRRSGGGGGGGLNWNKLLQLQLIKALK